MFIITIAVNFVIKIAVNFIKKTVDSDQTPRYVSDLVCSICLSPKVGARYSFMVHSFHEQTCICINFNITLH